MPLSPRGDRIVAAATLRRQERAMARVVHAAIREYLTAVRRAVAHTAITADAADGQPDDLGPHVDLSALDQAAVWPAILASTVLPQIDQIIVGLGPQDRFTPAAVTQVNAWRAQWMHDRTQYLVGVPDTITKQIRDAIQADADELGPDPARAAQTVKALLNPDAPTWKSRAQTIARTEVVSANNQGGLASWRAVHDSIAHQGGQVYKTWLATEDSKTRPDHTDIDGTEIGIAGTFTVGGHQMNGPGEGPADEVINCRCTLTYRIDDGAGADAASDDARVDDGALAAAAEVNGEQPTGAAVLLMLSPDDATRLAVDGGEPAEQMHVTLGYLADPAASYTDQVKAGILDGLAPLADMLPITADAFATAHFNPEDEERDPCAVVLVQSDQLASIHDGVSDAIASVASTTFPIWIPHVTCAYNADPTIIPTGIVGGQLTFDRLTLAWGPDETTVTNPPTAPPVTAAVEAPVTAPTAPAPPQPADSTPSEAAPTVIPGAVQWEGVLAVLDAPAAPGDPRVILSAGFTVRPLPLPLKYQAMGCHGGEDAGQTEIVGRILTAEVRGSQVWGTGDFFDPSTCYAAGPAIQQVAGGIGCISLDLPCQVTMYIKGPDGTLLPFDPGMYMGDGSDLVEVADTSELAAATIVDVPAFGDARITLVTDASLPNVGPVAVTADAASPQMPVLTAENITLPDGTVLAVGDQISVANDDGTTTSGLIESIDPASNSITVAVEDPASDGGTTTVTVDASQISVVPDGSSTDATAARTLDNASLAASGGETGLTAALAFPGLTEEHIYPADWFDPVALDGPTHLTVTDDGRVYGHLAQAGTCHIGFGNDCVNPPESPSNYAYFHVGEVKTDKGLIAAGKLTVGGGHADLKLGWRGAAEHYDNAGACAAVVRAYRDEHGIQVAGALLPQATGTQIAALRRNDLSGDWRPIGGQRELIGALSVNTAGFQLSPRAALAADGRPLALVAAGIVHAPAGDGAPEPGTVTLPSGMKLSTEDAALLASVFADVIEARQKAHTNVKIDGQALRRLFEREMLRDRLRTP